MVYKYSTEFWCRLGQKWRKQGQKQLREALRAAAGLGVQPQWFTEAALPVWEDGAGRDETLPRHVEKTIYVLTDDLHALEGLWTDDLQTPACVKRENLLLHNGEALRPAKHCAHRITIDTRSNGDMFFGRCGHAGRPPSPCAFIYRNRNLHRPDVIQTAVSLMIPAESFVIEH